MQKTMVITLTIDEIILKNKQSQELEGERIQVNFSLGNNSFDSNMYKLPNGKEHKVSVNESFSL